MTSQTPTSFSIEAEDIISSGFSVETTNKASGGAVASLFNGDVEGSPTTGALSYTFAGVDGVYDIRINAFDENDGASVLEVYVNGSLVGTLTMDNASSSGGIGNNNNYGFTIEGLDLAAGDVIEIVGTRDAAEWARVDSIDFIAEADTGTGDTGGGDTGTGDTGTGDVTPTYATVVEGLNEVEDLTLSGGYAVETNARYDNGAGIWNIDSAQPDGAVTGEFSGTAGNYDMTIVYYDESDGQADYQLLIDGVVVDSWSGTGGVSNTGDRTERLVSVDLADGSVIEIQSSRNDMGEVSRIGSYTLTLVEAADTGDTGDTGGSTPTGEPIVVEAEALTATGYYVETSSAASGGEYMSLFNTTVADSSETGTLSYTFTGGTGTYELAVAAFDENDGAATLDIYVNGELAGTIDMDTATSLGGVSTGNRIIFKLEGLQLATGDLVEIVGHQDGGEWARIDKIAFTPTSVVDEPSNIAPTGSLGDAAVEVGSSTTIDLDAAFSDANNDALTYTISGTGASAVSLSGSTLTIDPAAAGTYEVTVTANDGELDSDPVTFTITATEPIEPGEPIVLEAEDIIASGFVVENSNPASGNQVASLLNSGSSTGTLAYTHAGASGTYTIDLTAFDEADGVSTINIMVNGAIVSTIVMDDSSPSRGMASTNLYTYSVTDIGLITGDVVTIEATQGGDEWARLDTVTLTYTGEYAGTPNTAPTGNDSAIAATVGEAEVLDLNSLFSDAEGDNLTFTIVSDADSIASLTGANLTIDAAAEGSYTVTVIANDGELDSQVVTLTVTATEDAPVVPTGAPILVEAEAMTATGYYVEESSAASEGRYMSLFNTTVADSSETGTLSFNFTGGTGTYELAMAVFDENDGTSVVDVYVNGELAASIDMNAETGLAGVSTGNRIIYRIEGLELATNDLVEFVGHQDGGEWARIDKFAFTPTSEIEPTGNVAPIGTLEDTSIYTGVATTIDLDAAFSDANNDALTYTVSGSGAAIASISGSTLTLDASANGDYEIIVTANDGELDSQPVTFIVTAGDAPANTAPTGSIADVDMEAGGSSTIDLAAAFTDVDGDSLTFQVTGSGVSIASLSGSTLTLDPTAAGDYTLTVVANDGTENSRPVTFTVSVTEPVAVTEIVLEAEDLISSGFVVENSTPASGGEVASLLNSGGTSGELSYTFAGGSATYDIALTAFDERDGVSTINILVNGSVVSTITLDSRAGGGGMASSNLFTYTVEGVDISTGDVVTVQATQGADEWARIDTLTFTPVGDTGGDNGGGDNGGGTTTAEAVITVGVNEAEDMDLANGFEVETRDIYDNGEGVYNLASVGTTGSVSGEFSGTAGEYVVTVHYLDESDGEASWSLLVNGVAVDSWTGDGGSSSIGSAAQRQVIVTLNDGDVVTVEGTRNDNGEMARLDSVEIEVRPDVTAEDVDFFVFAGQSNAERHFYRAAGDTSEGELGADVFASTISALTGFETTVIEAATGGSGSNENADPTSYWWDLANDQPGPELLAAIAAIDAQLASGADIDGIIWSQGEDDARAISSLSGDADEFVANLKLATTKVFEYFWATYGQDIPIFIQEIGDFPEGAGYYSDGPVGALDLIRQAQTELIAELSNVYLGAETAGAEHYGDIHFSVAGYGDIAEDLATNIVSEISSGSSSSSQSISTARVSSFSNESTSSDNQVVEKDDGSSDGFLLSSSAVSDKSGAAFAVTTTVAINSAAIVDQQNDFLIHDLGGGLDDLLGGDLMMSPSSTDDDMFGI